MIRLYNTLTRKKEIFKPLKKGAVSMYHCGPTVYNYAHIGNFRSYVFADTLRRVFESSGFKVKQVINITDFGHLTSDADEGEDKMLRGLKREGKPLTMEAMKDMAHFYAEAFKKDIAFLNIKSPYAFPYASEHIPEYVALIKTLESKRFLYTIRGDGIYFDVSAFPSYGKLSRARANTELQQSRIGANVQKKNPQDFAVWKFGDGLGWDSPWGRGFPGWHIECSGMSMKYLGKTFDIHTGGIEHIPIHHQNEIAQSESATGKPLARYWLHNNFVTIEKEKISKSLGNDIYMRDIMEKGISPLAYRYWLLTAHYRTPVNFTWEALEGASHALLRLYEQYQGLDGGSNGKKNTKYAKEFEKRITDDLDTPGAIAILWRMVKDKKIIPQDKKKTLLFFDEFLGLGLRAIVVEETPQEIKNLAASRERARKEENWKEADEIRKKIKTLGYIIEDSSKGPRIKKI